MYKKIAKISVKILIVIIIVGSLGAAGYFYKQYKEIKDNPNKISIDEIKSLTTIINKFMDLPADETPTLATVTDKEKLKDQDFFKKSENGDKILIYANAKKAILYRPSTQKVIEFAPLLIGNSDQNTTPTEMPTKAPTEMPTEMPTKAPTETPEN
jgi:CRISPR/Cas system CMR-associated protein Cmr5 small subunit